MSSSVNDEYNELIMLNVIKSINSSLLNVENSTEEIIFTLNQMILHY